VAFQARGSVPAFRVGGVPGEERRLPRAEGEPAHGRRRDDEKAEEHRLSPAHAGAPYQARRLTARPRCR